MGYQFYKTLNVCKKLISYLQIKKLYHFIRSMHSGISTFVWKSKDIEAEVRDPWLRKRIKRLKIK